MNKYSEILKIIGRIALGLFMIAVIGIGFAFLVPLFMFWEVGAIGVMLGIITIPIGGFMMLQGFNVMILNQPYRLTGYVNDGQSTIEAVRTLKYTKLSMWFCFLGFLAYVALSAFFITSAFNYTSVERVILIVCAIISAVISVIYFLMAGKRKIDIKHNIDIEEV